ncbi:MAG: thiol-disulfide oxidoreductase DCC family protein [Bdellovibrionia bacterium]
MDREIPSSIVFFDGVCNLCNGFVDFLVRQDHRRVLRFASLQGKTSRDLLGLGAGEKLESVVFYQNGSTSSESLAVLRILSSLGGAWRLTVLLRVIPGFVRDPIYRFIARNRYRWFGKRETCRLPSPDERALFLD